MVVLSFIKLISYLISYHLTVDTVFREVETQSKGFKKDLTGEEVQGGGVLRILTEFNFCFVN